MREGELMKSKVQSPKSKDEGREVVTYILDQFDKKWSEYLEYLSDLQEGIYLLRIGGESPLRKFQKLADGRFQEMMMEMEKIGNWKLGNGDWELEEIRRPSSTWNYVVNDSPFENQFAINLLAGSMLGSYRT